MTGATLCWYHCCMSPVDSSCDFIVFFYNIQVVPFSCIHMWHVQLSRLCPWTFCTLLQRVACIFVSLIALVLSAWFSTAIQNHSVSFLRQPDVSQASASIVGSLLSSSQELSLERYCLQLLLCSCLIVCLRCMSVSPFQLFRTYSLYVPLSSSSSLASIYTVSQKTRHPTHVDNFAKNWSIFKILSLIDSEQNFLHNKYCIAQTIPYRRCCITLWKCNVSRIV